METVIKAVANPMTNQNKSFVEESEEMFDEKFPGFGKWLDDEGQVKSFMSSRLRQLIEEVKASVEKDRAEWEVILQGAKDSLKESSSIPKAAKQLIVNTTTGKIQALDSVLELLDKMKK